MNTTQLTKRLLAEHDCRSHRNRNSASPSSHAFNANEKKRFPKKNGGKKVICHQCRYTGHYSKDCRKHLRGEPQTEKGKAARDQAHNVRSNVSASTSTSFTFAMLENVDEYTTVHDNISATTEPTTQWLADSGATSHFCTNRALFSDFRATKETAGAYSGKISILGRGNITVRFTVGSAVNLITLRNVAFVPNAPYNLLSLTWLTDTDAWFSGKKDELHIFSPNNIPLATGKKIHRCHEFTYSLSFIRHVSYTEWRTTHVLYRIRKERSKGSTIPL